MPRAASTWVLASGVVATESTVVRGVTFAGFVKSLGTSETNAKPGKALPVMVSMPPFDTTLAWPSVGSVNESTLK